MKNIVKNIAVLSVGAVVALSSCSKSFEDINTNPNSATTEVALPTPYLLTTMQRDLAFTLYDQWNNFRQWGTTSQHWTQTNYTEEDRYQYRTNTLDYYYTDMYNFVTTAKQIKALASNPEMEGFLGAYGDVKMQAATADILRCWTIMMMCQTTGDTPYSEAGLGDENLTPKYDKQIDIFKGVIEELKAAYAVLKDAPAGWSQGDIIYGGDSEKWAKFANSLRLQYAMRLSNFDPTYSKAEAAAAIADGVFESNEDNAVFTFTGPSAPNYHPIYDGYFVAARNDFTISRPLVLLMKGENDDRAGYTNIFKGLVDPRLNTYMGPVSVKNGLVNGQPYGLTTSQNTNYRNDENTATVTYYTATKALVASATFWSTFMDFANVSFLQAELNGNDKAQFIAGVEASLAEWSAADAAYLAPSWASEADAYVAELEARFDAASAEEKLEMILTQKYIHNFGHFDQEAWFEYSRTGYPNSLIQPGDVSVVYEGEALTFEPLAGNGKDIATRLPYNYTDATSNKANLEAAIASTGGDDVTTPLIWQKTYNK